MTLNGYDINNKKSPNIGTTPADFVLLKATEGATWDDPTLTSRANQVLATGKLLGIYHFAGHVNTAQSEINHFVKRFKPYIGKAIPVLDWEGKAINQGPSFAKAWLDGVYKATGVRPIIYLSLSVENEYDWSAVAKDYSVWIAQYNSMTKVIRGYQPRDLNGHLKYWKTMAMFQYTSCGRLGSYGSNLDLDVFYGDKNAWNAYATAGKVVISKQETTTTNSVKTATGPIADVQSWLNSTYRSGLHVDNLSGPATKKALAKGIQTEINRQFGGRISVDGIFGKGSKAGFKTVRKGASGNITRLLQGALICKGYSVNGFDGIFGGGLQSAVQQFQRSKGLSADGIVGKATAYALFA